MIHVDDLSRSMAEFDHDSTLVVVVEMSESSWLVAGMIPGVDRQPVKKLAPDPDALRRLLERWRAEATKTGRKIQRIPLAMRRDATDFGWRGGCRHAELKFMSFIRRASRCHESIIGLRLTDWTPRCSCVFF